MQQGFHAFGTASRSDVLQLKGTQLLLGQIQFLFYRNIDYTQYGNSPFYQSNVYGELSVLLDKFFCAVQRIYNP